MFTKTRYALLAAIVVSIIIATWSSPFLQAKGSQGTTHVAASTPEQQTIFNDIRLYPAPLITRSEVESANSVMLESDTSELLSMNEISRDKNVIIRQIETFADAQDARLFGQSNWIRYSRKYYFLGSIAGGDTSVDETWFHTNDEGLVTKHLTISKSPDGVIRQFVVFQEGRVVNLLVTDDKTEIIGDWRKSPEPLEIASRDALRMIDLIRPVEKGVVVTALLTEKMEYIVTAEYLYEDIAPYPHTDKVSTGTRWEFVFDWKTGALLSYETWTLRDGAWIGMRKLDSILIELHPQLPPELDQLFVNLVNRIGEEGK
jgi:hypothetical protein